MSTSGPDDPSVPSKPSPELEGLDPKDLLNASLETVPPVTLPPQPVDPAATIPMSGPRPTLAGNKDVDLPLPEELSAMLPPGAYHVESFLGQGGMGAVYKGTQVRLKRPVAIKIMRRDLGKDHDFEARFEREAQAMAKLNHPNIVSVIDYGEAGPAYLYIVMELVDGADLMDVIRGGQMTQEMALSLLPQICDALQFAHDHGIVHRDIKPSNIMLTRDGRIKMADFGLAKHFDAESSFRTQTGTGMGTPDYAAPEQFSPDMPIDHRADIYALGVMIYQMITGQLPRGAWKPPSQRAPVAPQWDSIVSRAMQSDPSERYQQASEVKTDVTSIPLTQGRAAGPPAAATGTGSAKSPNVALGGPSALPQTKSRAQLLLGLIASAAVVALGAFIFMKEPAPKSNEAQPTATVPASAPVSPNAQVSRMAAEMALSKCSRVVVEQNGRIIHIAHGGSLPSGDFRFLEFHAGSNNPDEPFDKMAAGITADELKTMLAAPEIEVAGVKNVTALNEEICRLMASKRDLKHASFQNAGMKDEWLRHFGQAALLEQLQLSQCFSVTDAGIAHLAKLRQLRRLVLNDTKVTGRAVAALASAGMLESLSVDLDKPLDWDGRLGAFPNLKILNLRGSPSVEGLRQIARLQSLTSLTLSEGQLSAGHLEALSGAPALSEITLARCGTPDRSALAAALKRIVPLKKVIVDGVPLPLAAPQVTASAIQWRKAGWTAEDLRNKTLVADGDWARLGKDAGALDNIWRLRDGTDPITLQDGVVRMRYKWQGKPITLKIRKDRTFGLINLHATTFGLGLYGSAAPEWSKPIQTHVFSAPLKLGDEGILELAALGRRLFARLDGKVVLSSAEIPDLFLAGGCEIQSENGTFCDIEYAILDGIADPLKALGWEVPDAVETALASVSPAVRPYVAYPERLKVPVPDWLRLASAEGGPLRIHTVGDPGAAKAALDLGEAARFDDFVFVASQDLGWIAVRRNGELWGRNADYKGQPKSVGPIQIKSLSTGRNCHWLEEDGTGGSLNGFHHHRWPVSIWRNERVTAASLHSAVASFAGGKVHRLAFDSEGNLLAHFSEVTRPEYRYPPSDWFRRAPLPKLGDGLAALTHDGRVRTWDFTTGAAFPGMDEVRGVVQLAYGSSSAGWGVMLSETGQATVFGSKGTEVPEDLAPPAKGGLFVRVCPGPIFAAQKADGSWVGWNSKERDLVAAVAGLGPVVSIASGRVSFRDGDYAEKPVNLPYLIYIQPKNGSKPGVSNAPTATTAPTKLGTPLVKPLTWLPAVHSEGNAAKYHSQTPDGWITGTPDNPGGIKVSHPSGPLGNFAVRLRYRWNKDARQLQVRVRDPAPAGVTAQAVVFDGHWAISRYDVKTPPERRTQSLTSRKRTSKLEPGAEGMLEVAVIGDRVIARVDNTTPMFAAVSGMSALGAATILSAGLSFRDVEMVSLDGIADPLKALGWEVPLNWQKAAWSANEVAQKKIVVEDGWARIGQAAGAVEKTWKLAVNGTPVSLGDGALRFRYRHEGRALTLKIRNHATYGYVTLWPSRLELGIWNTAYAEREKRVQTRVLATPLKDGEEGVLELAADGRRLFARLNGSIVLTSDELPDLGLTGGCEIQSDGVSFRDVEYAHLGGTSDPLKTLGWEEASPASATKDAPFINSLGMKFVPVPITGVPMDQQRVLFSIWETRVQDYEVFAKATQRKVRKPTFAAQQEQGADHPVVAVSREDAMAFCEWLTSRHHGDGRLDRSLVFRLPTDHEWSCAVGIGDREDPSLPPEQRGGITDAYPWGTGWPPPPGSGNYLGQEREGKAAESKSFLAGYFDGFAHTAPVGQYRPNPLGLFDLGGNVWELTSDWLKRAEGEPRSVTRGAAYSNGDRNSLRSAIRSTINTNDPWHDGLGFRVVVAPAEP
jgi:predicted Ser/Thr protein kinase